VEVCTLSRRGNHFIPYLHHYSTAFAFSTFLYPLWYRMTLRSPLSTELARHHIGLTTFHTSNKSWEGSAYPPVIVSQRICTKQTNNRSHAILARARYYKLPLALNASRLLTAVHITLTIQLSLVPHPGATPEITPNPSRGLIYPIRWLHCQSA
jgi:hypothetical protein